MRGVGHELTLRADRFVELVPRALEALHHLVETGGEGADLVVGVDREATAEVVGLADLDGRVGDLGERGEHAPGGEPAERGGDRDAGDAEEHEEHAQT